MTEQKKSPRKGRASAEADAAKTNTSTEPAPSAAPAEAPAPRPARKPPARAKARGEQLPLLGEATVEAVAVAPPPPRPPPPPPPPVDATKAEPKPKAPKAAAKPRASKAPKAPPAAPVAEAAPIAPPAPEPVEAAPAAATAPTAPPPAEPAAPKPRLPAYGVIDLRRPATPTPSRPPPPAPPPPTRHPEPPPTPTAPVAVETPEPRAPEPRPATPRAEPLPPPRAAEPGGPRRQDSRAEGRQEGRPEGRPGRHRDQRTGWDDRARPQPPTPPAAAAPPPTEGEVAQPEPEATPDAPGVGDAGGRRRRYGSYGPPDAWLAQKGPTQPAQAPPPPPQQKPRYEPPAGKPRYQPPPPPTRPPPAATKPRYQPPPPPSAARPTPESPRSAKAADPVVSVALMSTNEQLVTEALLKAIRGQRFLHEVEVVVVRTEREPGVTSLLDRYGVKSLFAASVGRTARSLQDQAAEVCRGEFILMLALDLEPEGTGWLDALIGPLLDTSGLVATRGVVVPHASLSSYDAYRFEEERSDPLDFVAFRRAAWERHPFQKSGNVGHRWVEHLRPEGTVRVVDRARATGRLVLPTAFGELVKKTFSNRRETLAQVARQTVSDTLADWEALRARGAPGPTFARAALVRFAEHVGRSRLKRLFE